MIKNFEINESFRFSYNNPSGELEIEDAVHFNMHPPPKHDSLSVDRCSTESHHYHLFVSIKYCCKEIKLKRKPVIHIFYRYLMKDNYQFSKSDKSQLIKFVILFVNKEYTQQKLMTEKLISNARFYMLLQPPTMFPPRTCY